ncbi:MAG: alpha/beta hydrolase, partial [Nevskiales bacterium]
AVLVIHGGGWIRGEPADMERFADRLVDAGYAVANISYRLAPEHRWPAQIEDCRTALRWLKQQADGLRINPQRIAAFGYSAGAHLAMALGTDSPRNAAERVQAVVAGSGPYDLRVYPESPYIYKLIGGGPQQFPKAYADASPMTKVSADDAPAFLYHGKRDGLVEVEQSYNMAAALQAAGVPVVMREEPFGHALTYLFDSDSFAAALAFLNQYLR